MKRKILTFWAVSAGLIYSGAYGAAAPGTDAGPASIDLPTAAKLAMVISYHAEYGRASGLNTLTYGESARVLADWFELSSLDGREKYYAITLYRGDGEPADLGAARERMSPGADLMVKHAVKREDGKYFFEPPPVDEMREAFFFNSMDEFLDYYSTVVPARTSQGFLRKFRQGISPYIYYRVIATRLLAADLGVDPADVGVVRITPDFDYVCEVAGSRYVVRLYRFDMFKEAEIIPADDAVTEPREHGDYEEALPDLDIKAREEDILDWLDIVRRVEKKYGFGEGPSVTAGAVNPILLGRRMITLSHKARSETMMYSSERDAETLD